jgi:adenosylhomocysteine nucleosidase
MASHEASVEASVAASVEESAGPSRHWSGGEPPRTGLVAAMEEEVAGVRARLVGARPVLLKGTHVTLGSLGGAPVALAVTGDGERNARRGLAALLAVQPVRRVIVVGVAGGLSPGLDAGTLVVGDWAMGEGDGIVHRADATLADLAATACGARRGIAVTATRIADTVAEKRRLRALATEAWAAGEGRSPPPAVVDLESAAFAAAATRADLPWLVLRAVSDTAVEPVPALLNQSRDEGGAVRRAQVVRRLLADPRALLPLLELRERVRTCAGRLAEALELIMRRLQAADAITVGSAGVALDAEPAAAQRNERRGI